MRTKEIEDNSGRLRSEIVEIWEDPPDKPVYFEAPKSGSEVARHKWQARYRYTKVKDFFDDGSAKERIKSELLPGTLKDLGAIEVELKSDESETTQTRPKAEILEFPKAS